MSISLIICVVMGYIMWWLYELKIHVSLVRFRPGPLPKSNNNNHLHHFYISVVPSLVKYIYYILLHHTDGNPKNHISVLLQLLLHKGVMI